MKLFAHDATVHPKDDPEVQAKGRALEAARTALSNIECRARELERERDASHDEVHVLLAAQEAAGLRDHCIKARVTLSQAQRSFDEAFEKARVPWLQQARDTYRTAALDYLTWLEDVALPVNQKMLAAQEAAEQAGLRMEPLHCPQLLPDQIAHRCRIGRQGLG